MLAVCALSLVFAAGARAAMGQPQQASRRYAAQQQSPRVLLKQPHTPAAAQRATPPPRGAAAVGARDGDACAVSRPAAAHRATLSQATAAVSAHGADASAASGRGGIAAGRHNATRRAMPQAAALDSACYGDTSPASMHGSGASSRAAALQSATSPDAAASGAAASASARDGDASGRPAAAQCTTPSAAAAVVSARGREGSGRAAAPQRAAPPAAAAQSSHGGDASTFECAANQEPATAARQGGSASGSGQVSAGGALKAGPGSPGAVAAHRALRKPASGSAAGSAGDAQEGKPGCSDAVAADQAPWELASGAPTVTRDRAQERPGSLGADETLRGPVTGSAAGSAAGAIPASDQAGCSPGGANVLMLDADEAAGEPEQAHAALIPAGGRAVSSTGGMSVPCVDAVEAAGEPEQAQAASREVREPVKAQAATEVAEEPDQARAALGVAREPSEARRVAECPERLAKRQRRTPLDQRTAAAPHAPPSGPAAPSAAATRALSAAAASTHRSGHSAASAQMHMFAGNPVPHAKQPLPPQPLQRTPAHSAGGEAAGAGRANPTLSTWPLPVLKDGCAKDALTSLAAARAAADAARAGMPDPTKPLSGTGVQRAQAAALAANAVVQLEASGAGAMRAGLLDPKITLPGSGAQRAQAAAPFHGLGIQQAAPGAGGALAQAQQLLAAWGTASSSLRTPCEAALRVATATPAADQAGMGRVAGAAQHSFVQLRSPRAAGTPPAPILSAVGRDVQLQAAKPYPDPGLQALLCTPLSGSSAHNVAAAAPDAAYPPAARASRSPAPGQTPLAACAPAQLQPSSCAAPVQPVRTLAGGKAAADACARSQCSTAAAPRPAAGNAPAQCMAVAAEQQAVASPPPQCLAAAAARVAASAAPPHSSAAPSAAERRPASAGRRPMSAGGRGRGRGRGHAGTSAADASSLMRPPPPRLPQVRASAAPSCPPLFCSPGQRSAGGLPLWVPAVDAAFAKGPSSAGVAPKPFAPISLAPARPALAELRPPGNCAALPAGELLRVTAGATGGSPLLTAMSPPPLAVVSVSDGAAQGAFGGLSACRPMSAGAAGGGKGLGCGDGLALREAGDLLPVLGVGPGAEPPQIRSLPAAAALARACMQHGCLPAVATQRSLRSPRAPPKAPGQPAGARTSLPSL